MPFQTISVIIPTLNEAACIAGAINSAREEGADEVVVADGGSQDETVAIATDLGARIIHATRAQRARQLNEGARAAGGDVLVFLHADTRFLPGSLAQLLVVMSDASVVGGGFHRRFQSKSLPLSLSSCMGNQRARLLGWFFGDQAIFSRREAFEKLSGFPETPRFEDLDFTRRLRALGQTRLIRPGVETSARRFRKGPLRRIFKDVLLTLRHLCLAPTRSP